MSAGRETAASTLLLVSSPSTNIRSTRTWIVVMLFVVTIMLTEAVTERVRSRCILPYLIQLREYVPTSDSLSI